MNLLAVPQVAMEGYYSKFILFTGATPPQKMQIWLGSVSNLEQLHEEKCNFCLYFTFNFRGFVEILYVNLQPFARNISFISIGS